MIKFVSFFILFSFSCIVWGSSIYKCESADGKVFFQALPCDKNQATTFKKEVVPDLNKSDLTRKERYLLDTYTLYKQSRFALKSCKNRSISSASDLEYRLSRYMRIADQNIKSGENLVNNGTEMVAANILQKYVQKKLSITESDFRSLADEELSYVCSGVARKLATAAGQTPNRSAGYDVGDLDYEGND